MAKLVNIENIGSNYESLAGSLHTRNCRHRLSDVLVIAVAGVICGCDGPTATPPPSGPRPRGRAVSTLGNGRHQSRLGRRSDVLYGNCAERLRADWPGVKAIGYTLRHTVGANGKGRLETRYLNSSRYLSGKQFSEAVRSRWSIESIHWTLDATMREDDR